MMNVIYHMYHFCIGNQILQHYWFLQFKRREEMPKKYFYILLTHLSLYLF